MLYAGLCDYLKCALRFASVKRVGSGVYIYYNLLVIPMTERGVSVASYASKFQRGPIGARADTLRGGSLLMSLKWPTRGSNTVLKPNRCVFVR